MCYLIPCTLLAHKLWTFPPTKDSNCLVNRSESHRWLKPGITNWIHDPSLAKWIILLLVSINSTAVYLASQQLARIILVSSLILHPTQQSSPVHFTSGKIIWTPPSLIYWSSFLRSSLVPAFTNCHVGYWKSVFPFLSPENLCLTWVHKDLL